MSGIQITPAPGGGAVSSVAGRTGVVTLAASDISDPDVLAVGEATISRTYQDPTAITLAAGVLKLAFFTARKTEAVANIRVIGAGTAAVGTTLARIGLYSVDGSGNITLIGSTTSDTALFASASATATKAITSGAVSKTAGSRYAVGILFVGSTTPPNMTGTNTGSVFGPENLMLPAICAQIAGQTDLPSSVAVGSLVATAGRPYAVLLPT